MMLPRMLKLRVTLATQTREQLLRQHHPDRLLARRRQRCIRLAFAYSGCRGTRPAAHANKPADNVEEKRAKRGPKPGTVARYREDDAALFPAIQALIKGERMSPSAAAVQLADQGRVAGHGSVKSLATRLRKAFSRSDKNKELNPTNSN